METMGLFELVHARRGSTLRLGWACSHSADSAYRCLFLCIARVKDFATFTAREPVSLPEVLSLLQGGLMSPSHLVVTTACHFFSGITYVGPLLLLALILFVFLFLLLLLVRHRSSLSKRGLEHGLWAWFAARSSGLRCAMASLRRHSAPK